MTMTFDPILEAVRKRISAERLSLAEAALAIGVGAPSLAKHLAGGYVRSDSLAKYRRWMSGGQVPPRLKPKATIASPAQLELAPVATEEVVLLPVPSFTGRTRKVVDLFCGCGGMSLGFERFSGGGYFETVLALDIEAPMVKVFNDNHPSKSDELGIARQSDITDFSCEAEVLAFYLDHLARSTQDAELASRLASIRPFGLGAFRAELHKLDERFLAELTAVRRSESYIAAFREIGASSLGQTSVIGFHGATKLPVSGSSVPRFGPLIWHRDGAVDVEEEKGAAVPPVRPEVLANYRNAALALWAEEVRKLSARTSGSGRGQLASAAERIERFLMFLESSPMLDVRAQWTEWRASREALRESYFQNESVQTQLRAIYQEGHQVSVLLGGPPCQGFSRIGRGKIRSLREQSVHVHEDGESVDSRNQLMLQYVLFVAALAPDVFLFENVRHFQAVVRSEGVEFDATDVLAEAIQDVSTNGLGYSVSRRIVIASEHAVPQNRERFVMAGVRRDISDRLTGFNAPSLCLRLRKREPVPLQVALEGLPEPRYANSDSASATTEVTAPKAAHEEHVVADVYRSWTFRSTLTDAHIARPPRQDDAEFFALMGPGKRWMDYRCDDAPTMQRLRTLLQAVQDKVEQSPELSAQLGVDVRELKSLVQACDGSLSLRLLLESIPAHPGEHGHHLLTATYLAKREGAHGDWMARMDATQASKTVVSHMSKDTYAFVHPFAPRTISVREAARIQSFPDDYRFGGVGLVDGFRVVGNAVPPLLSLQFAEQVAKVIGAAESVAEPTQEERAGPRVELASAL